MEVQCPRVDVRDSVAFGSRRALGRVEHIDTVFLWVQNDGYQRQDLAWQKPTKEMPADFLTKHVDAATMLNCMSGSGLKLQSGESKLTLKA